jgi:XapX domain-containing protein
MQTIGSRLDANKGIGPGFDLIRVVLAFGVIAWHCIPLTAGSTEALNTARYWILVYALVPTFFAVSGFLVTGSAMRLPLGQFAASRILRIVPALAVDTAVSVLIFGTLFTTLPVLAFLLHHDTQVYWLNIVGEIHFHLPGVFEDHPNTAVNGSLWTIRPELACYIMMGILIATGLVKRWPVVAAAAVILWAVSYLGQQVTMDYIGKYFVTSDHTKLVIFFLVGSLFFLLRYKIPASPLIAGAAVLFMIASAAFGTGKGLGTDRFYMLVACPLLTYLIIWLGLQKLPQLPLFNRGDYSYGIYLYGYPMQQAVIQVTGVDQPWQVFVLTFVPVTVVAMMSWHFVEKPTLKLRKRFSLAAKIDQQREASAGGSAQSNDIAVGDKPPGPVAGA